MAQKKEVIGGPLEINGRVLSLSRAVRAGDFVFFDWTDSNARRSSNDRWLNPGANARYSGRYY